MSGYEATTNVILVSPRCQESVSNSIARRPPSGGRRGNPISQYRTESALGGRMYLTAATKRRLFRIYFFRYSDLELVCRRYSAQRADVDFGIPKVLSRR